VLLINGNPIPCPRCQQPLPGWRREQLHDGTRDVIARTIECDCGFATLLETFVEDWRRRPRLTGPGRARRTDPQPSKTAAAGDFGGRRRQVLDALANGPLDAHQLAEACGMDANAAARRARDLIELGLVRVHDEHVGVRGRPVTRWALTERAAA